MTTLLRTNFFGLLVCIAVFATFTSAFIAPNDEITTLTWGDIKATSDKINLVKTTDFLKNINAPLTFSVGSKAVTEVNAVIVLFPIDAETPPSQVDLVNGAISEADLLVLKQYAKWGTKVFIEKVTYTNKGKIKPMVGIGMKLN